MTLVTSHDDDAPLVAYRGLWDKFAAPGTAGALRRAYRRGIPSLVRLDAASSDLQAVLDEICDPSVNVRRQPVYLVDHELPWHERLAAIAAKVPALFVVTPGESHDGVRPIWRWRLAGWTASGCYVPAAALLHAMPDSLPAPSSETPPTVLVESLNVIDDLTEQSRFAGFDDERVWQAIRGLAGPRAKMARVSDLVELDQLEQRIREAA